MLHGAIPQMLAWLAAFRRAEPDQAAGVVDLGWEAGLEAVCVSAVVDIEESVWAPRYGLKGIIDASVQLRFQPLRNGGGGGGPLAQVPYVVPPDAPTVLPQCPSLARFSIYAAGMMVCYWTHAYNSEDDKLQSRGSTCMSCSGRARARGHRAAGVQDGPRAPEPPRAGMHTASGV